jgi:hypothetical protein
LENTVTEHLVVRPRPCLSREHKGDLSVWIKSTWKWLGSLAGRREVDAVLIVDGKMANTVKVNIK